MKEQKLRWEKNYKGSDKEADEWEAYNNNDECVGALHYERLGAFMHWLWYQTQGYFMSAGCLDEVRDKQKQLLKLKNSR